MKTRLSIFVFLTAAFCASCPRAFAGCEDVPAGQTFRIRLLQPVSSYGTKAGTPVRGTLIESPRCYDISLLPEGAVVEGHLKSVHKVGLGFRYEVASLEMEFDRILLPNGQSIQVQARVQHVDNARERVRGGVIHGIRATNTPQDHLTGRVEYFTMWSPSTFWIVPAYRAAFPFLPEPEINLPAGTDLVLELVTSVPAVVSDAPAIATDEFAPSEEDVLDTHMAGISNRTSTPAGDEADIVNVALLGSRKQIEDAFEAAGWMGSEPMSARAAFHEIGAFLLMKNNPRGPMSRQVLGGKTQELSLQKGLDSLGLRDHLRIWNSSQEWLGQPVWFGASTHDITATFSLRKRRFLHHIDGNIDSERGKIVRDLSLAGCVAAVHNAPGPAMPLFFENASGDEIRTDGDVAVIQLKECEGPASEGEQVNSRLASRPPSIITRYVRTQVLSFRDVWRENAVYGVFEIGRTTFHAIRRKQSRRLLVDEPVDHTPVSTRGASDITSISD